MKESVANEKNSTNTKVSKLCVYGRLLKWKGVNWEKPRLGREETDPFLPQISEVEQLISGSGWKLKSFLQLIWECALRGVEANELLWEDMDTLNRTVRIRPRKRGKPRTLRVSEKCLQMLMRLPRTSAKVFGNSLVQQGFELVGRDESGCLWRKRKTFEDIAKEREQQNSGVKSENSGEKIL